MSAFLIELLGRLEQDPLDIIQDVLIYQTQMMRNSSLGPYVPPDFSPPEHIVVVNALFYASLGVMILAAFIAMLIKSWVREFDRGLRAMSLLEQRAKTREFRYLGMERWKLPEMVGILPLLIQISLLLFAIGLVIFLFHISTPSFGVTAAIFGIGILYYAMTTSISVIVTSSPFHSPLSRTLGKVYQHMHAYFCPNIEFFLSEAMDTTPATALGRVHRRIQIFLQKSRPYPEKDFVEPISATAVDEVQLSTAALALQRIHDSAPNSQHSEALHWAVWHVAGSAAFRVPPLFNLPSWIGDKWDDNEYFSDIPPSKLVALVVIWLRTDDRFDIMDQSVLRGTETTKGSWVRLISEVFDRYIEATYTDDELHHYTTPILPSKSGALLRMVQRQEEESLWLLNTLSELYSRDGQLWGTPYVVKICLEILLERALNRDFLDHHVLESVVTLAAISCSPDRGNQSNILTSSREHPWLLLNMRNPALFNNWFEDMPSNCHESLISLLFLVVYALIDRRSYPLAVEYFTIITAKGDLLLHTSALTAVAPAMRSNGLTVIGRMLMAQTQELTSRIDDLRELSELLENFDHRLEANENPGPNFIAILLICFAYMDELLCSLQNRTLNLKNPWLRLGATMAPHFDTPDGSGLPIELCFDHRVHNMIAARFLLNYMERRRTHDANNTDPLLLASFLQSRELLISSVALEIYMETAIFSSDFSAPSSFFSRAVHAVFDLMLPDHQLWMGWRILETFVNGFDSLPLEWRRPFAEAFFTLSRRRRSQSQGDTGITTLERELHNIVTWEYFHQEEQDLVFTNSEFSGLDWMAIAWSLHLSQRSGGMTEGSGQEEARSQDTSVPAVKGEFVLKALYRLLDAAPYYQIIPILPKLGEFIQWFDDADLSEYRRMISTRVKEVVRRHEESQVLHKFDKFQCMWYI